MVAWRTLALSLLLTLAAAACAQGELTPTPTPRPSTLVPPDAHSQGEVGAPVTVVEFSDFQ
ncbi:MAG: hypothetical protein HYY00_01395 [Chloroflexi bacterium]|nr:hypothetical protein [Chloroflexota bacterium]